MNSQEIQNLVQSVIQQLNSSGVTTAPQAPTEKKPAPTREPATGEVPDISQFGNPLLVPEPQNRAAYEDMLQSTSARIGVWRTGTRPLTKTMLKFRADHGVAQDAVLSHVDQSILDSLGFIQLESKVADKDEFLTRPDLGRLLSDDSMAKLQQEATSGAQVQIVVGDGLSAKAIDANIQDVLTVCRQGLENQGYSLGKDIFVKNARVGIVNCIGEVLKPELILLLIGERPGLGTAESMSAYLTYKPTMATVEAQRTMISNIHKGGIPPVEAGAQIASLVQKILTQKTSGLDLEL
ncbi:MAG: ethanolamine ammonia-lyase subunit EutC [Bacillota bacterium]|nr:ethanolamine ammonia-lyase subunit EutC [Bacillota bacterium]